MTGTPLAATDLSREILNEVLEERGQPGSGVQEPVTTFAAQIQNAIDQGATLDELRRCFHLSESELSDYCSDLLDDGLDEDWSESASGY